MAGHATSGQITSTNVVMGYGRISTQSGTRTAIGAEVRFNIRGHVILSGHLRKNRN